MKGTAPIARKNNIVVQEVNDETLIYDLKTNKAYCLNETSALVYELCDGTRDAAEISNEMSVRLKTLISEEFVWLALDQFVREELLENVAASNDSFGSMSRREVIRKVGFASVVALPMVSSLVAPSANMAQSAPLLPLHSVCTMDPECASGNCVNGFFGMTCCSPTSTQNFPPGANAGVVGVPFNCIAEGQADCCSGSATAVANPPGTPGVNCICD